MKTLLALLALSLPAFAADVSGYVYAMDGSVVAGATVRAGDTRVTTGEDGAFAFTGLPEGVVELEIEAKGYASAKPLVLSGDLVTVTLLVANQRQPSPLPSPVNGEETVRGRVTLDGKPLANAPVIVGSVRVLSNAKGEYVATGVPPQRLAVMPDERLFPRLRWPHARRIEAETREASTDVELRSAQMIRGRVVDADGKPVARARVQLVLANRSTLDFAFDLNAARTMPDGRFSFPAPEWTENEQVQVAVTPLLQSTIRSKPFALGSANRDIDMALPKLESVRVRVLDRAGKPIPEARVAYASSADTGTFESIALLVEQGFAQRAPRTDAEGELVLQLAPDTYDFTAAAEGFQTGTLAMKSIARPMIVDLTLERAATLRGRVRRGDRGVANVNVTILGQRARGRDVSAHTDADGKFEIAGLAPGAVRLHVFKQDELIDRTLDVEAPGNIDVALPPTGTLRGRVIDAATGGPVREFVYMVAPVQAEPSAREQSVVHRGETTTDGTFTMEIPAGSYRVSAGATGFTSLEPTEARVVQNETTTVDLSLGRGAVVNGRVTDENGLPLRGATVTIAGAELERMRTQRTPRVGPGHVETGEDGVFTITGVEPGEAQLTVRMTGYVPYRKTLEAEGTMSTDIRLTRGLSIHGIVTLGGKPLADVQVGASTSAIGGEHQPAITDDDGRFTLSGLIPARYTVSAYQEESHAEVRDVDPSRQKEVVLSLDPKPRGVVYGTVTGIPPALGGKYVRRMVIVQGNDSAEAMIDDAGNYRIENAPVGNVTIGAYVESSSRTARSSARKQVEIMAGQPLRVDLDLGGHVRVSGRITLEGTPVAGAHVVFASEDGTMGGTQTRDDGLYEVTLPAAGRYHVYARAEQLNDRHFRAVRDIRGGETIDIDLREQVVEGTVVDAVTRQPIAGALVTLAPAVGPVMSVAGEVPTDPNGRFRIVTAVAGPHRLIASASGYAHRVLPLSGSTMQYAFELSPAPDLRVRVIDSRTGAALDAHVVVSDTYGLLPIRARRTSDGTTFLFSLAPGKYRLMMVVQGFAPKTVDVTAPGVVDVALE